MAVPVDAPITIQVGDVALSFAQLWVLFTISRRLARTQVQPRGDEEGSNPEI